MNSFRALLLALIAAIAAAADPGAVYRQVYEELARHPHRLPGSTGLASSQRVIEQALAGAGLQVGRQTFRTLAPRTTACRFTVGGREVGPVLAVAPNYYALSSTLGREVGGPLVYLGQGEPADLDGKQLSGSIALLELGSPNLHRLWAEGVLAVILVGNDEATQWAAAAHLAPLPIEEPRFYIDRGVAERAGLLARGSEPAAATLSASSAWEDVEGVNLWAMLPAAAGSPTPNAEQTIVLSATVDTFGLVPDSCPQLREAANAALLAEVAAVLARAPMQRNVLVVFLGSHYAAEDAARHLYYVAERVRQGDKDDDTLAAREAFLVNELAAVDRRLGLLAGTGLLAAAGDDAFYLVQRLRRMAVSGVNGLNYDLRTVALQRDAIERRLRGRTPGAEEQALLERNQARRDALKAEKTELNGVRRQIHQGAVDEPGPFQRHVARLRGAIERQRAAYSADLADVRSWRRLEEALRGRGVLAHLAFDFADAARPWTVNPYAQTTFAFCREPGPGVFSRHLAVLQESWRAAVPSASMALVVPPSSAGFTGDALCTPRPRPHPSAAALSLGKFGGQCMTVGDALDGDELPGRRPANLLALAPRLAAWLPALGTAELPAQTSLIPAVFWQPLVYTKLGGTWRGLVAATWVKGSEEVEGPAERALVTVWRDPVVRAGLGADALAGRICMPMGRVNPDGRVFMPNVVDFNWIQNWINAVGFSPEGLIDRIGSPIFNAPFDERLFYVHGGGFFSPLQPGSFTYAMPPKPLLGRTDSEPQRNAVYSARGASLVWQDRDQPFKIIGNGVALLAASEADFDGDGFAPDRATMLGLDPVRQGAADYTRLNRHRLEVLRSKNLINRPVEELHSAAQDHLERAQAARAASRAVEAGAREAAAAMLAWRAYLPIKDTANDLLKAVIILLLLSIPFAFVMERLVLGATSIYRQIAGFAGIFLATFAVLYVSHPAFALASAPIVIFLAFVIILLSGFVIYVVMGKFREELKALQGLSTRAHSAGERGGTALAAVIIGISGLRNRPLKTFLTIATVTLLTFTILVFASFEAKLGVASTTLGRVRGAERIELHDPAFLGLPPRLVECFDGLFADRFEVCRRAAVFGDPTAQDEQERSRVIVASSADGLRHQQLAAVLALDPREAARLRCLGPGLSATAAAGDPPPLLLSASAAIRLGLAAGDRVTLRGVRYRFAGTFDDEALKASENIDGSRLLPPDFGATLAVARDQTGSTSANALSMLDVSSFIFCQPEAMAVTTLEGARPLSPTINFVALYAKPGADVEAAVQEIAPLFKGPVYANSAAGGARRHFYTRAVEGSGYLEVLVPLLLGGLIIFSSLLGSIVDRQKEIFTNSALGLAPGDIAALFFAESAVIAVIGGMGGYLIGQLVARLLAELGSRGLVQVPDVNFSSFSSLATIVVVMGVVMLSTVYPALTAGRSANPGINRAWRMPKPEGGRLSFTFPFTVPAASFAGIVGFIHEHFGNHGDAALDIFSAKHVRLYRAPEVGDGQERVGIEAEVALAPFDLGVLQRFRMHTRPSDVGGIDEVVVELERMNGAPGTWLRGNRQFIDELRNQFLLWRSLPVETTEHYQREAAGLVAASVAAPAEASDHG